MRLMHTRCYWPWDIKQSDWCAPHSEVQLECYELWIEMKVNDVKYLLYRKLCQIIIWNSMLNSTMRLISQTGFVTKRIFVTINAYASVKHLQH